jgi:Tfp pilus assembly protein PilN
MIVLFFGLGVWTWSLNSDIAGYSQKIADLREKIAKNQNILDEINSLKEQKKNLQEKIRALERIDVNREKWIRLQELFCQKLPEATWVERLDEKSDTIVGGDALTVLEIEGKTYSFSEVALYMSRLMEAESIKGVELVNIEQIDNKDKIFRFIIICKVNPDIRLRAVLQE